MKKTTFFLLILLFTITACRDDASEIVLDRPFKITVEPSFMNNFGRPVKGIVVSTSLGGILIEKILTEGERSTGVELETLIDETHKIMVTFLHEDPDLFLNRTFSDVRSGAVFKDEKKPNYVRRHKIRISGVNGPDDFRIPGFLFLNFDKDGSFWETEIYYPLSTEFLIFYAPEFGGNPKYFHSGSPDTLIQIDLNDFKDFDLMTSVSIPNSLGSVEGAFVEVTDNYAGEGKKVPVFHENSRSENKIRIHEIQALKKRDYAVSFSVGKFGLQKRMTEFPASFNAVCEGFRTGIIFPTDFRVFQPEIFNVPGDYFLNSRSYFGSGNTFRGNWVFEGLREDFITFKVFPISSALKNVLPKMNNFREGIRGSDFLSVSRFQNWDKQTVLEFPHLTDEFFFNAGTESCRSF